MADNEPRISEVPTGLVVEVGRIEKGVVTEASHFVTSHAAGEWGMGPNTGGRRAPTHDEIARLAFHLYESRAGKMATTSEIGCVPRRNSGVTCNCEVPRSIGPRTGTSFARVFNVGVGRPQRFWYGWKM
jgi:hypothetical protein